MFDFFDIAWLLAIGFFVFWHFSWALRALRSGVATYYFHYQFDRNSKPFEYWMLIASRIVAIVVGTAMFLFGLHFALEL